MVNNQNQNFCMASLPTARTYCQPPITQGTMAKDMKNVFYNLMMEKIMCIKVLSPVCHQKHGCKNTESTYRSKKINFCKHLNHKFKMYATPCSFCL